MSNQLAFLQRTGRSLIGALFPQRCFACGAWSRNRALCPACEDELPRLGQRCSICALPTPGGSVCGACLKDPPAFDETHATFAYAFPIDRMIQALKYQHRLHLAPYLADTLAPSLPANADWILPMPLHPQRLRSRGFNQAVEIARRLLKGNAVAMSIDAVVRERNTPPQASLPWKERQCSVRGAFRCQRDLAGRHVVVIDDVMTTGATLNELARCLKGRAAARVTNLVVARTLSP